MRAVTLMIKPVSGQCDMRCSYCFYADALQYRDRQTGTVMSLSTLETAVRRTLRSAEYAAHFLFQGGEPTLAGAEFYRSLLDFQKKYNAKGLQVTNALQTNGLHLSEELLQLFVRERFLIGISLDGTALSHDLHRRDPAGQGTWSRVRANAIRLREAGAACNILCVVTGAVAEQAEAVFRELAPFRWLQFIPCMEPLQGSAGDGALTPEAYGAFLRRTFLLYEEAWQRGTPVSVRTFDNWIAMLTGRAPDSCAMSGRCGNSLMLESDGTLYPCDFYGTDEWALGSINELSLPKALKSEKEQAFLERSVPVPEACRKCTWYSLCRNGCERERTGPDHRYRWCGAYQEFFPEAVPRMRNMAKALLKE